MSTEATDSMEALITSFSQVPPAAVPAVLDCILASTGVSRSSLFASLLHTFTNLSQGVVKDNENLDTDDCNYLASLVGALCHLLKKFDTDLGALESFIWKCFLPLIKMAHMFSRNMLNQITGSFISAVIETNSWVVLEATLVPIFLRLVASSIGMPEKEVSDIFQLILGSNEWANHLEMSKSYVLLSPGSPSLPIVCHILTLMLDVVLQRKKTAASSELTIDTECLDYQMFVGKLTWGLCSLTEQLLLRNMEYRTSATTFLLPIIFEAFSSYQSLQISIDGRVSTLSRNNFLMKIWKCCGTLFSLGNVERRDAFGVLSLYLSFFPFTDVTRDSDLDDKLECFDLRAESKFWDEIKRGLVDKESLVRKQSLQILKIALDINGAVQSSSVPEDISADNKSMPQGMTKREQWADKEAKSLGVGKISNVVDSSVESQNKWVAFVLLYEMLEEYGTHLVEAAWNFQVSFLLQNSSRDAIKTTSVNGTLHQNQIEISGEIFNWLAILWERGFNHDNPLVRCLIMQSFLGIDWMNSGILARSVPRHFVLGSFIQGLNDPVHHKEFGVKGIYSSVTIRGAANFLRNYAISLNVRKCIMFLSDLASAAKQQPLGRVGLMCLAECTSSAARQVGKNNNETHAQCFEDEVPDMIQIGKAPYQDKIVLLDALRFIIESSKQHFNSNYRLQVCEKVLESAASVVCTCDLPLDVLLHFISTFPWEFTDHGGPLRQKVHQWLMDGNGCSKNCCNTGIELRKSLHDFPNRFTSKCNDDASTTFDDEDLDAWEFEAKRWARVLFIACEEEYQLLPILTFIQTHGSGVCKQYNKMDVYPVKFLILILSLVLELQMMQERVAKHGSKLRSESEYFGPESVNHADVPNLYQKFTAIFLLILEKLVCFAKLSCSIFSINDDNTNDMSKMGHATLPGSVTGKLGGPSQRRLSSFTTSAVLRAIMSIKAVATLTSFCAQGKADVSLDSAINFLWDFYWKTISSPACDSEIDAEICLAAYEALAPALTGLVSVCSPHTVDPQKKIDSSSPSDGKSFLDSLVLNFLQNINNLITTGVFTRSRRAILMNWKWICLESLLSIPCHAHGNGFFLEENNYVFSDAALRFIFSDILESLENAGEGSVLPMLRSVRLVLDLFAYGKSGSLVGSCDGVDSQMLWHLVRSSWILHVSCNKRKVAPIAALLSSVLHSSLFSDEIMHISDGAPGPLKWFVEKILEEGTKSPRTIRLAALHLTGLWLAYPKIIKYYVKELKLLSLHGSLAFDEDFEGELADNRDSRAEVSLLAKGPDLELTKEFINTELYARASVAVLFYKLADMAIMVGSTNENADCHAALECGKMFLLELLDSAVNDKDLAKELYKKYSAIHRRKVRAWQMICILSPFVCEDIVSEVSRCLHTSLYMNNLPAVRQYLETFAINMYLKFPPLVEEQLVPMLRDYDMRSQALSSYVFIAANVILHASQPVQHQHLNELLPPIVPLLTSHHHSLRGFTQLLIYQVLCKLFPPLDSEASESMTLEKRCFQDLKSYLAKNSDCTRLRHSMEGYLDAYSPLTSITPAGVFVNRVEDIEFECVSISLMEQVINFLNNVRENLRKSMAEDVVAIKNESLRSDGDKNCNGVLPNAKETQFRTQLPKDISLDFQKKITLFKHEKQDINVNDLEKDDRLLAQVLQTRTVGIERERSSRQHLILVASLLDRIPNLAGLARTCEIFKVSSLAIADTNVLHDKQFQLISVTAEKWVPLIEVPVNSLKVFLQKKKREGFSILGLEQTANSIPLDQYNFPKDTVLVLGREKEGIPVDIIHFLDACLEIPQLGVVRSLNVHVSGAIAMWEYTRQQRSQ